MTALPLPADDAIGLRELRHHTREVIERVRNGESLEVTDHGQPVARLVPCSPRTTPSVLDQLVAAGLARRATKPGVRPRPIRLEGDDVLSRALEELRAEERY